MAEALSLRVYVYLLGDCAGTGKAGRSPAVVLDADFSAEEGDGGDGDSMQSATHTVLTAGRASRRAAAVAGDYAAAMRADATLGQSLQVPTFEFKGHRCIFAAASEFFRERLYRPTSLTSSGRAEPRVTLSPAVTVDAFAAVRSYIYTGQVVVTIDGDTARHCDRVNRIANGKACGMKNVPKIDDQNSKIQIAADTVGSKQPMTRSRHQYFQSWVLLARDRAGNVHIKDVFATFSERNDSAASLRGFEKLCQEAGLTVYRDATAQQLEIICDQGKEYLGDFIKGMQRE